MYSTTRPLMLLGMLNSMSRSLVGKTILKRNVMSPPCPCSEVGRSSFVYPAKGKGRGRGKTGFKEEKARSDLESSAWRREDPEKARVKARALRLPALHPLQAASFVVTSSTITATARRGAKLCRDPGSSRGPSDLQSDALPTELSRL